MNHLLVWGIGNQAVVLVFYHELSHFCMRGRRDFSLQLLTLDTLIKFIIIIIIIVIIIIIII